MKEDGWRDLSAAVLVDSESLITGVRRHELARPTKTSYGISTKHHL